MKGLDKSISMNHFITVDKFEELQKLALKTMRQVYAKAQGRLWKFDHWEYVFVRIMAFLTLAGLAGYLLIQTWNFSPNAIVQVFGIGLFLGKLGNLLFCTIYYLIYLVFVLLPIALIDSMSAKFKMFLRLVYFLIFLPASAFVAIIGFYYLLGSIPQNMTTSSFLLSMLILIDIIVLVLAIIYIYMKSQMSYWMFIMFVRPIDESKKTFLPTYDGIVKETANELYEHIRLWNKETLIEVANLARQKSSSIAVQAQTFSPLIGTFSLFSLFAVILNQDEFKALLRVMEQQLGEEYLGLSIYIIILAIIVTIFLSCRYFMRIIISLRLMDILIVLLEKRAKNVEKFTLSAEDYKLLNALGYTLDLHNHQAQKR